jgi:hypothetical protein
LEGRAPGLPGRSACTQGTEGAAGLEQADPGKPNLGADLRAKAGRERGREAKRHAQSPRDEVRDVSDFRGGELLLTGIGRAAHGYRGERGASLAGLPPEIRLDRCHRQHPAPGCGRLQNRSPANPGKSLTGPAVALATDHVATAWQCPGGAVATACCGGVNAHSSRQIRERSCAQLALGESDKS